MKTYLVDTNVFIQIKNYFGLDVCEGFWEWMIAGNVEGKVFSVEKVAEELTKGNDELADWAKKRGSEFFLSPDQKVIKSMRDVSGWVHGDLYTCLTRRGFMLAERVGLDLFRKDLKKTAAQLSGGRYYESRQR